MASLSSAFACAYVRIDRRDKPTEESTVMASPIAPRYLAPELFESESDSKRSLDDDFKADVYALGVVFWETTYRKVI